MNLLEAGLYISDDHRLGARHGFFGRQEFPGVWAKMIAAKDDPFGREIQFRSDALDKSTKVRRCHSGISTLLVYLIARGFYENRLLFRPGAPKRGLDDKWMRRANRSDAAWNRKRSSTKKLSKCGLPVFFDPCHASFTTLVRCLGETVSIWRA